jgi:hypothetical protein
MFPCLQGERYWPLTANVGFLRARPDDVAKAAVPWGRGSPWARADHDTFEEPLRAPASAGHTLLLSSAGGEWTTVLESSYPDADVGPYFAARAYFDLGCEFVGVMWEPAGTYVDPGAHFVHQRAIPIPPRRRFQRTKPREPKDLRFVESKLHEGRWEFGTSGPQRDFEEPDYYERRRKAERLPRELLARYAAAVGVAVDDPGWWDGPVIAIVRAKSARRGYELSAEQYAELYPVWSTVEELRAACRYPLDEIPDDLVRSESSR